MKECLKLLAFVVVVLAIPIMFLEGCVRTRVTIVHPEIPCVITNTGIGMRGSEQLYERTAIDCKEAEEEKTQP